LLSSSFRPIPSVWGHQAGGGINPTDIRFIDRAVRDILARPPGQEGGDYEGPQTELNEWKIEHPEFEGLLNSKADDDRLEEYLQTVL
jgi:hypothetical protein